MIRICEICGSEFEDTSKYKPRINCSIPCGNYTKFKNGLENSIIALNLTKDAKKIIKGDMFRLANLVTIGTFTK